MGSQFGVRVVCSQPRDLVPLPQTYWRQTNENQFSEIKPQSSSRVGRFFVEHTFTSSHSTWSPNIFQVTLPAAI